MNFERSGRAPSEQYIYNERLRADGRLLAAKTSPPLAATAGRVTIGESIGFNPI